MCIKAGLNFGRRKCTNGQCSGFRKGKPCGFTHLGDIFIMDKNGKITHHYRPLPVFELDEAFPIGVEMSPEQTAQLEEEEMLEAWDKFLEEGDNAFTPDTTSAHCLPPGMGPHLGEFADRLDLGFVDAQIEGQKFGPQDRADDRGSIGR